MLQCHMSQPGPAPGGAQLKTSNKKARKFFQINKIMTSISPTKTFFQNKEHKKRLKSYKNEENVEQIIFLGL